MPGVELRLPGRERCGSRGVDCIEGREQAALVELRRGEREREVVPGAEVAGSAVAQMRQAPDPLGAPADLTRAVAAAQIRLTTDDETILAAFTCTITDSTISLHLPSADAVDLPTSAVWDLQITDSGIVTTLLYGKVTVQPEVTRP